MNDKHFLQWVNRHNWDSHEKDKHLMLRHLKTYFGDEAIMNINDEFELCAKKVNSIIDDIGRNNIDFTRGKAKLEILKIIKNIGNFQIS